MNPASLISTLRRLGRRKFLLLAMVLVFLFIVRLSWGWLASRQLESQFAILRSRGDVVTPGDVAYASVPDNENAFTLQVQAAKANGGGESSSASNGDEIKRYPPYPPEWLELVRSSERLHAKAFVLARKARQFTKVQIREKLTSPVLLTSLPYLSELRELVSVLADGALLKHLEGDDAEALDRLLDILHIARSLRQDDLMIPYLVAIGMDALACETLNVIAPALPLDSRSTTRPALLPKIQQLMEELLDEQPLRESACRMMLAARMEWFDLVRVTSQRSWIVRPMADRAMVRKIPYFAALQEATSCTSFVEMKRKLPPQHDPITFLWYVRYSRLYNIYDATWASCLERHFRGVAERRMTATALACQLYRADRGSFPQRLDQLAPAYLPRVPSDPYHDNGQALGYMIIKEGRPDGADRPVLCFDAPERDSGIPREPTYSWHSDPQVPGVFPRSRSEVRQYRDLTRFLMPPSKETVDDKPEESDRPGGEAKQDEPAE